MIETNIGELLLSTTLGRSDPVPAIDLPALACDKGRPESALAGSGRVHRVQGGGFEPPKAEPAGLQPAPFGHSGIPAGRVIVSAV